MKIIAKNPPSIAIALAGVLALTGQEETAILFLGVGCVLQVLWIFKNQ